VTLKVALVTKFMGGGSLDDIFVNRSSKFYDVGGSIRFHFQRIVAMTSQAAAGVAHLHACGIIDIDQLIHFDMNLLVVGIIHRDLACRNFLADESGNVAVADFGFARERWAQLCSCQLNASV
jgi:serine/threonine protein kinase